MLAITTPAGAQSPASPTTNRIHGADRYSTAIAVARNQVGAAGPTAGLVIASGESYADSLSAAVLTSDTRPLILVPKDSTPASVTDFILDYKSVLAGNTTTVYFMGGVNAISAANYTALTTALTTAGDTTPPTFKRLAGADRYATANLAATQAGIMVAADKLIVVNGDSWADGISAGVMSAEAGWPIVLQTKTGNNASAKKTIDAYLALTSSVKTFIIVGGTGALSTDTESYLINTKAVKPANIIRLSGADRYATSLRVNNYVRTQGTPLNNITGVNTALVSGESPWDALAATSWAAKNNALVQLTPAAGGNASVASLAATYAAVSAAAAVAAADYAGTNLFIIGGKTAVPDAVRTGFQSSAANNLTTSLTGCVEGGTTLTLTVSSPLSANEAAAAILDDDGFEQRMTENAGVLGAGVTDLEKSASVYDSTNAVFTVTTAAQVTGDVWKFGGVTEDVAFGTARIFERSIGSSSCTVANDAIAPVVTMTGRAGTHVVNDVGSNAAGMVLIVTSNEPLPTAPVIAVGALDCGATDNATAAVVTTITTGLVYSISLANTEADLLTADISAGDICTLAASIFVDRGGLSPAAAITATLAADATAPAVSVSAVNCAADASAAITAGGTTFTATDGKAQDGAAGNSYRLTVVNSRGLMTPSFVVDDTAKTIVVTADVGYHTPNDLIGYQTSTGAGGNWTITAGTGLLTATVVAGSSLAGDSNCTLTLSSNEPIMLATAGITISVAGLNAGYISAVADANTAVYAAATANTSGRMSRTITFDTKILGAGSAAFAASASGISDQKGNNVLIPVTFTAG
jgi:putative cell wall-binding protein